jgi:hypothetical protein
VIRETTIPRPDGSIKLASIDDGEGCFVFLSEGADGVQVTLQFGHGGRPLGAVRLTRKAVGKLAPLLAEIAARNETGKEAP